MKRFYHLFFVFYSLILIGVMPASAQEAEEEGPTMGWSSWNTYGVNISAELIKRQALAMSQKLRRSGYKYINIDDGYFGGRDPETGQLLIHPDRFPDGLKGIVDFIHSKDLKAGIYSDAGRNTCGSMFSNDPIGKGVGLYEHDQQDMDYFFKELNFDFIKVDFCGGSYYHNEDHLVLDERERYTAIAEAIKNTGRTDVRMNACRWAYPGTWISDVAFSWRTTGDINCSWGSVKGIILENLYLSAYCRNGHYNDMDMLEVGRSLSADEDKTHFGMWCIMSSPLLIGCDMVNIKDEPLKLLKNKELIALNQDPLHLQAYVVQRTDSCYVLVKDIEERFGLKRAFAVFNASDKEKTVTVDFSKMDLGGVITLRDVFNNRGAGTAENTLEVKLAPHATAIYTATAEHRLERTLYEAETGFIGNYQEIFNNQSLPSGTFDDNAKNCSGGCKVNWLGKNKDNYLEWSDVYSQTGGKYRLKIAFLTGESRNLQVSVNGTEVKKFTSLNSGSYDRVSTKTLEIQLNAGVNTIRLSNPTAYMPDIDYISLELLEADAVERPKAQRRHSRDIYNLSGQRVGSSKDAKNLKDGIYVIDQQKVRIP